MWDRWIWGCLFTYRPDKTKKEVKKNVWRNKEDVEGRECDRMSAIYWDAPARLCRGRSGVVEATGKIV